MLFFFFGILIPVAIAYVVAFAIAISPRRRLDVLHMDPEELSEHNRAHADDHH